ncbi:MAG: Maf family protein [Clostridiales Family XIII bacterium]|jgi:septum formation protein|nr:Maf family protein [Clostridiales Family XIII bacterium]
MEKVILASASPRRRDILNKHGVETLILPSDVDETLPEELADAGPDEVVMYLAVLKARAVRDMLREDSSTHFSGTHKRSGGGNVRDELPRIIIAADTIVYKDGIIGKPVDADDAFRILSSLRNNSHGVYTGVAILDRGEEYKGATCDELARAEVFFDLTTVTFRDYPDSEIWRYIEEEPPYDKSGSYAVQSSWSVNIANVDGDIENVMGLPWHLIEPRLLDNHQ